MSECDAEAILSCLKADQNLSSGQASAMARALADSAVDPEWKKAGLLALARKGETPTEVAAFAEVFRGLATDPGLGDGSDAIDLVGTGGDHSGSFNVSTTAAMLVASMGVKVIKHGNRSVTSKCGSADLLEGIGVDLNPGPEVRQEALERLNFVFLFAPAFHPAFKEVVPIRKALAAEGHRTIFNLLGPLINPGRPGALLMGVFSAGWVSPLAEALDTLGVRSALVVNSALGEGLCMDELTCAGLNRVAGVGRLADQQGILSWEAAGLARCDPAALKGGGLDDNLAILRELAAGQGDRGLIDTICFNAGAALWIGGQSKDLHSGVKQAQEQLRTGGLADWLAEASRFFAQ